MTRSHRARSHRARHRVLTSAAVAAASLASVVGIGGAVVGTAGAAAPHDASPAVGKQVLDLLCAEQGGTAYTTPFTISRCQEARTRPGFEVERLVCEGLLGGTFRSAPSTGRLTRTTWICSPGPVS